MGFSASGACTNTAGGAFVRAKLDREREAPLSFRLASRVMLSQVDLLWRRRVIDYLLLRAVKPSGG